MVTHLLLYGIYWGLNIVRFKVNGELFLGYAFLLYLLDFL